MKVALVAIALLAALEVSATAGPTPEALYAEGQAAYDRADYATAIVKWQASYRLSGASGLLFDIGQAYRLSGDCEHALSTYKQFIAAALPIEPAPTNDQRPLAEELVRELEQKCGTPTPAPIVGRPVAEPGRTKKLVGLVTGGAGLVLFVTGAGLGHHGAILGDEVTSACAVSCDWATQRSKDAAGRRDTAIGYTLDVLGVAAVAGGAIWYYLGDRENEIYVAPLARRPQESGAVISWSGTW